MRHLHLSQPALRVQIRMEPTPSGLALPGSTPDHGWGGEAVGQEPHTALFRNAWISSAAELCRVQEARIYLSPSWLYICLLWPCLQRSLTTKPSKCLGTCPCVHVGFRLRQHFCYLGFYLTRREKNKYSLLASHIPHTTAQLTLAQSQG